MGKNADSLLSSSGQTAHPCCWVLILMRRTHLRNAGTNPMTLKNSYKLRTVQMHSTDVQAGGPTCEGVVCCACLQQSFTMWQPISFTTEASINLSSLINLFPIPSTLAPAVSLQTHPFMGVWKGPDWLAILLCRVCTGSTGEMGQSKTRPKGWIWASLSSPVGF